MGCGVCAGKPIDFQNMASPGQQALDPYVAGAMKGGMQQGATPYPGQLSQGPVDPILQAIQMMYSMGGLGQYGGEQGGFPGGPMPPGVPSGTNASPFGTGFGPADNGSVVPRGPGRGGPDRFDPQNLYDPQNPPVFNPRDPYNMKDGRPVPR